MTDRGMRAVADMAARHPSLEALDVSGEACTVCVWDDEWKAGFGVSGSGGVMLVVSLWLLFDCAAVNGGVTKAGWAALSAGVRRNPNLALKHLEGVDLAEYDDTLPDHVVKDNNSWNITLLRYYRAQARVRRRVAAVAVLRTAWRRSHGRPVRAGAGAATQPTRAAELAHMVQLRRVCRVREGEEEVVEPLGRCVVAYL